MAEMLFQGELRFASQRLLDQALEQLAAAGPLSACPPPVVAGLGLLFDGLVEAEPSRYAGSVSALQAAANLAGSGQVRARCEHEGRVVRDEVVALGPDEDGSATQGDPPLRAATALLEQLVASRAIELSPGATVATLAPELAELLDHSLSRAGMAEWVVGWLYGSAGIAEVWVEDEVIARFVEGH